MTYGDKTRMSSYHINEGSFDLPDAWADRTLHIFSETEAPDPAWNIVISRDKAPDGESLSGYVTRQLGEMSKALQNLKVIQNEEIVVDGAPAREIISTWLGERGVVRQRQVALMWRNRTVVFTLTVTDYLYERHAAVLDELLKGFRLRRD